MSPETRWTGEWWDPAIPERVVHGELVWNGRARLSIHPGLAPVPASFGGRGDVQRYAVLHGRTVKGEAITLLEGLSVNRQLGIVPELIIRSETIASNAIIIGAHVARDARFEEFVVEVPGLERWLPQTRLGGELIVAESTRSMTFHVDAPPDEVFSTARGCEAAWVVGRSVSGQHVPVATITTTASVRLRPDSSESLDECLARWNRIATFLTFAWGAGITAGRLRAKIERERVTLYVSLNEGASHTLSHAHEFFLPKAAPDFDANAALDRWIASSDAVDVPSRLARSVLSADQGWIHLEFLSLMQALEGLHRALGSGHYMPREDYEPLYRRMAEAVPGEIQGDHRMSLKNRLRYGNEVSLRKRLKALCERLPARIASTVLGGVSAPPHSWVETRNYFTHWDEAARGSTLDDHALVDACLRLRVLLVLLYLDFARVPDEVLFTALRGASPLAQHLLQINADATGPAGTGSPDPAPQP